MYARFSFQYDFASPDAPCPPRDARLRILDNIAQQIGDMAAAGLHGQVKGALAVDFNKNSFSLTCTEAFAGKLAARAGIVSVRRL